jgi:hypothetical protein
MEVYEMSKKQEICIPNLKDDLRALDDLIDRNLEIAAKELPMPPKTMDVWMNTEELVSWLADVLQDFYFTGRQMLGSRVAVERVKRLLADVKRQSKSDRELGGLLANFEPLFLERIETLKEMRFVFKDRQDIQRVEIEAIRSALFALRPPL